MIWKEVEKLKLQTGNFLRVEWTDGSVGFFFFVKADQEHRFKNGIPYSTSAYIELASVRTGDKYINARPYGIENIVKIEKVDLP